MFSHLDLNNGRISDVLPKNMYVSHSVLPDLVHCISLRLAQAENKCKQMGRWQSLLNISAARAVALI